MLSFIAAYYYSNRFDSLFKSEVQKLALRESILYSQTKSRIEQLFRLMYQSGRMISLLPEVREITGGNLKNGETSAVASGRFNQKTRDTVQQIYNNLAVNVNVSEVYAVLEGFSPESGETPFFMYDELILKSKKEDNAVLSSVLGSDIPIESEEEEYQWFVENIPLIKSLYPEFNFSQLQEIPAFISDSRRTCDNTQYLSIKNGQVEDSHGFIMAIPFYGLDNQFRGIISVIFRSNILEAALLNKPFIPITSEEKKRAAIDGWRLPSQDSGYFVLNSPSSKIKDRRIKAVNTTNDDGSVSIQPKNQLLTLGFSNQWSLTYYGAIKLRESIRNQLKSDLNAELFMLFIFCLISIMGIVLNRIIRAQIEWDIEAQEKLNEANEILLLNKELTIKTQELEISNEKAQQASKAKGYFLANMSHEIRTPMNGIMGLSELLSKTKLKPEQREFVDLIKVSSENLLVIINDILDFSKIEEGKLELELIEFNLNSLISSDLKPLSLKAEEKGLNFISHIAADVPQNLWGDSHRLVQILINLVGNAIKFTEKGTINLNIMRGDKTKLDEDNNIQNNADEKDEQVIFIHFALKDSGIGIAEENIEHVFTSFSQEDSSTTRRYGGTGLGLSIASQLIKLMNGKIWVESILGEGSTFHFTSKFKVQEQELVIEKRESKVELTIDESSSKSLKILLAEDNLINQKVAGKILKNAGHRVSFALNGEEAVNMYENRSFDLILMDVQMPIMSGYEATMTIREIEDGGFYRIPIIAMTANAMKGDKEKCIDSGMDDYISKPIDSKKLIQLIDTL